MKNKFVAIAALAAFLSTSVAFAQDVGFGEGIPLQMAVKRIVPEGMDVSLGAGVDGAKRVSWTGEGGWRQALEQAIEGTGYVYAVNDGKVVITAAPSRTAVAATETAAPAARPAATPPRPQNNSAAPRPSTPAAAPARPAAAPVASIPVVPGAGFVLIPETGAAASGGEGWQTYEQAAPAAPEWVVASGQDLHGLLEDWTAKAGWRLVWESEYSYSLTSAARFQGDFITASTELLRSMQDVRPTPTATFHQGNKVLVIANDGLDEAN